MSRTYPHMCRDGHPEVGHFLEDETCPVCAERERCARIAEQMRSTTPVDEGKADWEFGHDAACRDIAFAIRSEVTSEMEECEIVAMADALSVVPRSVSEAFKQWVAADNGATVTPRDIFRAGWELALCSVRAAAPPQYERVPDAWLVRARWLHERSATAREWGPWRVSSQREPEFVSNYEYESVPLYRAAAPSVAPRCPNCGEKVERYPEDGELYCTNFHCLSRPEKAVAIVDQLLYALHDAITRPKGVVPDSAAPFYSQKLAEMVKTCPHHGCFEYECSEHCPRNRAAAPPSPTLEVYASICERTGRLEAAAANLPEPWAVTRIQHELPWLLAWTLRVAAAPAVTDSTPNCAVESLPSPPESPNV